MKNKYMRRSHLSERKFRELVRLFAADLSAARIAEASGVSRPTVNAVLSRMRGRAARPAQEESPFAAGETEMGGPCLGAKTAGGEGPQGANGKTAAIGLLMHEDKVSTQVVRNCSAAKLAQTIRKPWLDEGARCQDEWETYDGIVDTDCKHIHRIELSDGSARANGIESFCGAARARLAKFRGIRSDKFCLHLKETEFRFNHRHDDLYHLLPREFRKSPL
jgi:transposase